MVSWRAGLVLLVVLAGIATYAFLTRSVPAPAQPPPFLPCPSVDTVYVKLQRPGRTLELERPTPSDSWRLLQPVQAAADDEAVATLTDSIEVVKVVNAIQTPRADATYGLDSPRETLTCRVTSGRSYNLSVGSQSFDGSGYYARKTGDGRVYVISSVEVGEFDRALTDPPVKPSPTPTT